MFESRIGLEKEELIEIKRLIAEDHNPSRAAIIKRLVHQIDMKLKTGSPSVSMDDDVIADLHVLIAEIGEEEHTAKQMLHIVERLKGKEESIHTGATVHKGYDTGFLINPELLKFEIEPMDSYKCNGKLIIKYQDNVWSFGISDIIDIIKSGLNDQEHGGRGCKFENVKWRDHDIYKEESLNRLGQHVGQEDIEWEEFAKCLPNKFLDKIMDEFHDLYDGTCSDCD